MIVQVRYFVLIAEIELQMIIFRLDNFWMREKLIPVSLDYSILYEELFSVIFPRIKSLFISK